jgi:hypothetical protein
MPFESSMVYGAVVTSNGAVRLVVSAPTAAQRAAELLAYVLEWGDYTLWPADGAHVRSLADARLPDAAVAAYFACVGDRWDEERLDLWQHEAGETFVGPAREVAAV